MKELIKVQPGEKVKFGEEPWKFDVEKMEKLAGEIKEMTEIENCLCACHHSCKHCQPEADITRF